MTRIRTHLAAIAALLLVASPALAQRTTLLEENDSLYFGSDKHYTQGLRLSNLGPALAPGSSWNAPFDWVAGVVPAFGGGAVQRRWSLSLGQSIFTPKNLTLVPPDPRDRPYGAFLALGAGMLQETGGNALETLELQLGMVGPAALGREVQNDWHQLIGINQAAGWKSQIQNEPGIVVTYDRLWRVPLLGDASGGVDLVPEAGAAVGNVFTYGSAGGMLRVGQNLGADYGPVRIRPALSGTDWFDGSRLAGDLGWYLFAGVQGRVVGRNLFLDGNSFRSSRSVDANPLVADLEGGLSLFWSTALRLDFSVVRRTREFEGQAHPDVLGTAALSFSW